MLTLVGDGILLVLILEDQQINFHVTSGFLVVSATMLMPEAP